MRVQNIEQATSYKREYGYLRLLAGNTKGVMKTVNADLKIITIKPGESTSHHFHLRRESLYHLQDGQLVVESIFSDKRISLNPGDTIIVDAGEDHKFTNISDTTTATILEVESPPHNSLDKILLASSRSFDRNMGRFWSAESKPKLKICGIKSLDTAIACFELGVDAIGIHAVGDDWHKTFAFDEWIGAVPQELSIFLLTDLAEPQLTGELLRRLHCDTIQIQGRKSLEEIKEISEFSKELGLKVVKSIEVPDKQNFTNNLKLINELESVVDAILLDKSWSGGTGESPDWDVVEEFMSCISQPVIIAGGISSENITQLSNKLNPYGIDVESSVEWHLKTGGKRITAKSHKKIEKLLKKLRG